jgi:hypothetical protein
MSITRYKEDLYSQVPIIFNKFSKKYIAQKLWAKDQHVFREGKIKNIKSKKSEI